MNSNQTMICAAMLETMWRYRHKDLIDLVTPFVLYAIAQNTSVGEEVNILQAQQYVQDKYAYPDFPEAVVKKALNRNPSLFERKNRKYYLKCPLDTQVQNIDRNEKDCLQQLNVLGQKIADYLNCHCQRSKTVSPDQAIKCLNKFFERYGLQVGIDDLSAVTISPKDYEIDYYISQFIFEQKVSATIEYNYIMEIVKGYFLRLAIYSQPENGNITSEDYSDVAFFYDTPILLDILGYQSEEEARNARTLHETIKKQKGKTYYFPHVKQEIIDILSAYRHSLNCANRTGTRTLVGLNQQGFSSDDVRLEISLLEKKLHDKSIEMMDVPLYVQKEDGTVFDEYVLDESGMREYVRKHTLHYREDNLDNDITSVLAIQRFRVHDTSAQIEKCKYLFVTNNFDFTKAFNTYYKAYVDKNAFPLVISDTDLAALTWVKCGQTANLPEMTLLKNAYSAMQPTPEIMSKLEQVLDKMNYSGQITQEQISIFKASELFLREIWIDTFGEPDSVTEACVLNAEETYKRHILHESDLKYQAQLAQVNNTASKKIQELQDAIKTREDEARKKEKSRRESMRIQADDYAKKEKEKWLTPRVKAVKVFSTIFMIIGIVGAAISIFDGNVKLILFNIILAVISALSNKDTVLQRKNAIIVYLEKKANGIETNARVKKMKEYDSFDFISSNSEK